MSREEKITAKNKFKGNTKTVTKNKLMSHIKAQETLGLKVDRFQVGEQIFCNSSFSSLTGISIYLIKKVLTDASLGVETYVHGQVCGIRDSLKHVQFVGWMLAFVELYGQADPVNVTTVLPAFLSKGELFKIYLKEAPIPHLKKSSFYFLFKKKFGFQRADKSLPNIRISKFSTHSRCDVCFGIEHYRRTSKTATELKYASALKFKHREKYSRGRAEIEKRKQLSLTFPSDHLHLAIDGMDNSKSYIPRPLEKTKKLVIWRLPSKITGAILTSGKYLKKRKVKFLVNHDHYEQGSNMIVSIIYRLILDFYEEHKMLPKILDLNLDNCYRENKNRFMFAFLHALVELDVFCEIQVNFLMVGHTGNNCDQLFSILTQEFKSEIKSLEELFDKMKSAPIEPKPEVESLLFIWDWKGFISPLLSKKELKYHSYYHSFQVKKEDYVVKFRAKYMPQDTEWTPLGGINLLNRADIVFEPVEAANFRIESLQIPKVYQDLQKYLMRMPMSLRVKVSSNWDALRHTLESLPSKRLNLPKMKLAELPKQVREPEPELPQEYQFVADTEIPELEGDIITEDIDEGVFDEEVMINMDVVCYTKSKRSRPWVGRITDILPDKKFRINWFTRRGRRNEFVSLQENGNPSTSIQENACVLLWGFTEEKTADSFKISNYWLTAIQNEYKKHD